MTQLTIVIPCYNEAKSLPELINQMKLIKLDCNFVLVDNGSTDETASYLESVSLPENIIHIKKSVNTGYGAGIKFGVKNVNTELVGWMHADLQQNLNILNNIREELTFFSKFEDQKLIAIKGLRSGRSVFENFFTTGVSIVATTIFLRRCWDIAGQPNIFRLNDLRFLDSAPDDHNFEFFIYIKFKLLNGKFIRFDAPFLNRKFGKSSWDNGLISKIKHARRIFTYIIWLRLQFRD